MNAGAAGYVGVIAERLKLQKIMLRSGVDMLIEQELKYQLVQAICYGIIFRRSYNHRRRRRSPDDHQGGSK
ncbi:polyketide synthase [Apiospora arundinis]